MFLYQPPYDPFGTAYSKDIRIDGQQDYIWIIGIDPNGVYGSGASLTATLSWNPAEFGAGTFELREGTDGTGTVVVQDMKTTTSYAVTGDEPVYYTIVFTPDTAAQGPEITAIDLGTAVSTGYYVAAAHPEMFSTGTVWVQPGQTQGTDSTSPPQGLASAAAPLTGLPSGYGALLVGFSTSDFATVGSDFDQDMPTNANAGIFGGASGPINKKYISLNNTGITAGTTATVTVDMNGEVPHLVAVMGGSAPTVTYNAAGSGTLTITSTTFDSTNNANESFTSMFGFMIFTDSSFGSTPLGIIAQTNHWVGDIFPLLPGWDSNAAVNNGAGTQGTITAKCGTTIVGLVGHQRNINIFFPDSAISEIFPNGTVPDDLAAFLGSGATHVQQPGTTVTRGVTNFSTTGTLAQFDYTFASPIDTSIGLSAGNGTINGTVQFNNWANNQTDITVEVWSTWPPDQQDVPVATQTLTYDTSAFTFNDIPEGTYYVFAVHGTGQDMHDGVTGQLAVVAGQATDAGTIPLGHSGPTGAQITGTVDFEQGYTWTTGDIMIIAYPDAAMMGQGIGAMLSTGPGAFTIPGLDPGTYYVRAEYFSGGNTYFGLPVTPANPITVATDATVDVGTLTLALDGGGQGHVEPPYAVAGADFTVVVNTQVTLDGSSSSGAATYAWTQDTNDAFQVTLTGADTAQPTFTPTATGTYTFQLIVNNGTDDSPPDTVTVNVIDAVGDETNIITLFANLNAAIQAYIDNPITANMDAIMSFFSTSFLDDGDDVSDVEADLLADLAIATSYTYYANDIQVTGGDAITNMTIVMEEVGPFGSFTDIESFPMALKNESGTWKLYGNQKQYEVFVETIARNDGSYRLVFGLEVDPGEVTSVTVTGPAITGDPVDLFDDGFHSDHMPNDGEWGRVISIDSAPTVGDVYTFTINLTAGGDPVSLTDTVSGIMAGTAANGTVNQDQLPPTISWDAAPNAISYGLKLFDSVTGDVIWETRGIPSTFAEYTGPPLNVGGSFQWVVLSYDANGNSSVSQTFTLDVQACPGCGSLSISGTVTDSSGNAIPNIWVNAYSEGAMFGMGGQTDAQGNYTISGLVNASDYRVDVWHENYAFQFYKKADSCDLPAAVDGSVDYATCGAIPPGTPIPPGTSDWLDATQVDLFSNSATGVNFILGAGVSISGTVKDDSGTGIGGVWVNAWSETSGSASGTITDPDGTYTITGLMAANDFRVEIFDDRFAQQFYRYDGYVAGAAAPTNNDYSGETPVGTNVWDQNTPVNTDESNSATGVNFVVSEGKSISGVVLAEGQPLGRVWVNAWSESKMTGNGAETDSQGNYTISGLPPAADYKVDIWTENYGYQVYDGKFDWMNADFVDVSTDDAVNINFFMDSGNTISGRVADDNGDGIPGVWVNAYSDSESFGRGDQTDADGNYSITGLADASDYRVDIWKEGYTGGFYSSGGVVNWDQADFIAVPPDQSNIDFTLGLGVYIEGTITLPGGDTDFSNVWVNAWSESTGFGSGTPVNNDGTYKIIGLKKAGDYRVDVWSEEHGFAFHKQGANNTKDWGQATLVDTLSGSVSGIDITLTAGNSISGTISGLDVGEWAWVNAWSESTFSGGGTDVVGTGSPVTYTIKGLDAANDYRVEVHPDNHQHQFYNGQSFWDSADLVDASTNPTTIDFTLSAGASISGTVTDGQGNGVSGVWVDAWSPNGSWGGATTDADGNFTIGGLTDGVVYEVNIWDENYANQSATVTTGSPEAGTVGFTVSAGITISGTVKDDQGNALSGVWVNAWSDSARTGRGEQTDNSGNYTIRQLVGAPDYRVDAWADGYTYQMYDGKTMWHEADLVDTTGGSVDSIDFTLTSGKSIGGSITVSSEPSSSDDIWVNAWSDSEGGMGTSLTPADFVDNGDNTWTATYSITNLLPANDYKVDVWSANYQHVFYKQGDTSGVSDWMQASTVDISTNNATGIDFVLGTGRSITGTVTVPGGGSLDDLWVNAWSESAGSWGNALVDPNDGSYTITGLASAGDFKVDIWSEAYGYQIYNLKRNWENADLVSTVSGDAVSIDFNLATGKSISGRITDDKGDGVTDAWVNVWSEKIRFGRGEPTDSSGNYTIKGLDPSDDYKLDVWSDQLGWAMYKEGSTGNRTNDWMQATKLDVTSTSLTNIDITLTEGLSISGRVQNDAGQPVSGAWVNAWSLAGGNGAQTASDGTYTIKGLPNADSYTVDVWAEGYTYMVYNNKTDWSNADPVDTSSGSAIDIDFILGTGKSISGNVSAGGNPVPYIWVNAWSESTGSWGGASTDSSGNYTMEGLADATDYVLDVWHESYAQQFYNLKTDWMTADRVDVTSGDRTGIDFSLNTGNSISGTITLPGGDTDYSYIWVNAWSDTTFSGSGTPVKYDGTYKIVGLSPGAGYKIDVWSDKYVYVFYNDGGSPFTTVDWYQATEIDLTSGSVTGKDMTLGTGGTISGTVYLPNGTDPAAYVWVDAWSSSTGTWGGAETAADGTYTISGLSTASDYEVSTWSWQYINDSQTNVSLGDTVDLTLSSGISISGNLHNDNGGIGGVWVDAWSSELGVGGWAISDGTGNVGDYTISGLKPNTTYILSASTGNHGFISIEVDVTTSDVTGKDLHITAGDAISGTVTKSDGTTVIDNVEVIVAAFKDGTFYNSTTASAADGTYSLTNLPAGNYKIKVRADGYVDMWYDGTDQANAQDVSPGTGNIDFAILPDL